MATESILPGYETTFITKTETTDDALKALKERVSALIASFDGQVVELEDWGRKRLAYPIQNETRGQYTYVAYTGKPGVVAEFERNLRIQDTVLRYLTVNLAEEFDIEEFKKERLAAKTRREEAAAAREAYEEGGGYGDRDHREHREHREHRDRD